MFPIHKKVLHKQYLPSSKRSWGLLVLSISSLAGIMYLVIYTAPTSFFAVSSFQVSVLPIFFLLLFLFLFGGCAFIFKSKIHGILIALLAVVYLLFRQNDLTHPFFAVLLLALFLVLELMFTYKK